MVEVERDLWVHQAQPLFQQGTQSRGPRATSTQLLEISMEDTPQSLGSLCQCSAICTTDVQGEPPVFQFVPTASCPGIGHHWEETGSVITASSLQAFIDNYEIPLSFLFLPASIYVQRIQYF